jgi:hypothetical protein
VEVVPGNPGVGFLGAVEAALPLDLINLAFAVVLAAGLEGEQLRVSRKHLEGCQQFTAQRLEPIGPRRVVVTDGDHASQPTTPTASRRISQSYRQELWIDFSACGRDAFLV